MYSSAPTFAAVQAGDHAEIFLCFEEQGARPVWMSWFLSSLGELDATYARARELDYEIAMEPVDESWGMREFHLRHPDGHIFRVSAVVATSSSSRGSAGRVSARPASSGSSADTSLALARCFLALDPIRTACGGR